MNREQQNFEKDDNDSAMIIAFGLCTISGFIIGCAAGWIVCVIFL